MNLCGWIRDEGWQEKLEEGKEGVKGDSDQTTWSR